MTVPEAIIDLIDRVAAMPTATVEDRLRRHLVLEIEGFCSGIREDDEYSQGYRAALVRLEYEVLGAGQGDDDD